VGEINLHAKRAVDEQERKARTEQAGLDATLSESSLSADEAAAVIHIP
jgi:hypothetical protein